ncbi:MAG: DUF2497 domain-containing protein [Janthinobacterium lividum]
MDDSDGSIETILASIRRIIREDDVGPTEGQPVSGTLDAVSVAGEDELLVLLPSMMVQPDRGEEAAVSTENVVSVPPGMSAAALAAAMFDDDPVSVVPAPEAPRLLAAETRAAAVQSLAALQKAVRIDPAPLAAPNLLRSGGPTLEDIVRDELRGQLKLWLDANLPALVERVVRQEIEQLVRRPT